jgi:hypothetical protein
MQFPGSHVSVSVDLFASGDSEDKSGLHLLLLSSFTPSKWLTQEKNSSSITFFCGDQKNLMITWLKCLRR